MDKSLFKKHYAPHNFGLFSEKYEQIQKHLTSRGVVDVLNEMVRQDEKWGADRDLAPLMWNAILGEEVGEVSKAILEKKGLREEIVQVVAVGLHGWKTSTVFEVQENDDTNRKTPRIQ